MHKYAIMGYSFINTTLYKLSNLKKLLDCFNLDVFRHFCFHCLLIKCFHKYKLQVQVKKSIIFDVKTIDFFSTLHIFLIMRSRGLNRNICFFHFLKSVLPQAYRLYHEQNYPNLKNSKEYNFLSTEYNFFCRSKRFLIFGFSITNFLLN